MNQTEKEKNKRQSSQMQTRRAKRKKQARQRLLILLTVVFLLGFLLGLLIGSRKDHTLNFILEPNATETSSKLNENLPWNLALVNFEYALEKDFVPEELAKLNVDYSVDSRILDAAKNMIMTASGEGVNITIVSAYRGYEYQRDLFDNKVQRLLDEENYSVDKAREEASKVVAYPGTSEHQLGLALDLVDSDHRALDESQETTEAYQWLKAHCHEYGFIVRYPNGKTDITGIVYEPWHFRYVGPEAAKVIMEKNITLEEYLQEYYR